jgi:hypothetical protein
MVCHFETLLEATYPHLSPELFSSSSHLISPAHILGAQHMPSLSYGSVPLLKLWEELDLEKTFELRTPRTGSTEL